MVSESEHRARQFARFPSTQMAMIASVRSYACSHWRYFLSLRRSRPAEERRKMYTPKEVEAQAGELPVQEATQRPAVKKILSTGRTIPISGFPSVAPVLSMDANTSISFVTSMMKMDTSTVSVMRN